ncbi:MAG: hypothetical protein ACLF0G_11850 [Candidatus Brocadiia bacterium]
MKSSRPPALALGAWCLLATAAAAADLPENLARKATAWASSEYSDQYLARFAIDGRVPPAGSQAQDRGKAWCVRKAESGDRAEFSLTWDAPVEVAELIYWGRTAWFMNECWRDYEVTLDDATEPAARGRFRMMHGPQRVKLPGQAVRKITIRFLGSYGGYNPGALEIQAFAASPSRKALLARYARGHGVLASMAAVGEVEPASLRALIRRLAALHGPRYAGAADHLAQLDRLRQGEAEPDAEALAALQRRVLLFDARRLVVIQRHEIRASHVYTYHYEGFRPGGGLYVVEPLDTDSEPVELVASPTGQILDCELSYDGKTILFSWRRQQDEGYHLWTIGVDGSGLRRLTDGPWHDYNACWLPDGGIAFLSTRSPQFAYCWHAPVGVVHRMDADGSNVRRLSANYLNDFTPAVLDDGRILYTRWEYVDKPAIPIQSLWTLNPDGSGLSVYFGNGVLSPGTFMEARPIPGTIKVLCTMTGHNGPTRGAIGVLDRARAGVDAQDAILNVTPDVPVPPVDQGNGNTGGSKQYSCPLPLDSVRFLCAIRGPLLVRTLDGSCQSIALEAPGNGMQWFSARPVRPRPRPPAIPSQLPQEADGSAVLYLQDVYAGLEPHVERGEVAALRVVREMEKSVRIDPRYRAFGFQFPVISCGATYAGKEVLGEVAVEGDGSACFRVPAGVPIYFMALDAQGRAVQRMRSFTHLMPGERQGCVGCHEPRQQVSHTALARAYARPPRELRPPEWGTGGFDYARIVQPVLDHHCVRCHQPVDPPKGLDLTGGKTDYFSVSYDCLAREHQGRTGSPYVNWIPTYNGHEQNILEVTPKAWGSPRSRLAEVVLSGHPDEDGEPRVHLDEASRRRILAWIDLNVPYYGTSETAYPAHKGCRRLTPQKLDEVLADVARRRCAQCHQGGKVPRRVWTRITEPHLNPFLLAPLARAAGGSGRCAQPPFQSTEDPDYQAILAPFRPVLDQLRRRPRMDMPGAEPAEGVSRSCQ